MYEKQSINIEIAENGFIINSHEGNKRELFIAGSHEQALEIIKKMLHSIPIKK